MTLYQLVHHSVLFLTIVGTFFWGKSLLFMDISSQARRLFIPFGPTNEDLKKLSQDKADGIIGVVTIFASIVLQALSLNWQENFYFILNPQLHINNSLVLIAFDSFVFFLLLKTSNFMMKKYFHTALNDRMKAIFVAHSTDKPEGAQERIIDSISKVLDLKMVQSESKNQFIKRIAASVGYQIPNSSIYLAEKAG